jgi:microcystin-dependent protein
MSDQFLGEVRMFAGNFAPQGWAMCQGQLLSISQNAALFSLLGTNFGGNGTSTFGLPNFQGTAPMHQGNGAGLTSRVVGEVGGEKTVTLLTTQLPSHTHNFQTVQANGSSLSPGGNLIGGSRALTPFASPAPTQLMSASSCGPTGGNLPHNNLQPYLTVSFIIAMVGIYPTRS